jgi:hypothetical protein
MKKKDTKSLQKAGVEIFFGRIESKIAFFGKNLPIEIVYFFQR